MNKISRTFLWITLLIMALCWGACVLCGIYDITVSNTPVLFVPFMLGGFSPTIASYIAEKKTGKAASFKAWLQGAFDLKQTPASYGLVLALTAAFFLVLCLCSGFDSGAPLFGIVFMVPAMLFGGGLEETGWRGLLLPELKEKYGFTLSTLFVAVIWWIWHLPLFYIPGVSQYGTDFLDFGLNVLGLSFALSAIKTCTGSTWLCVLFHCLINSLHSVYLIHSDVIGSMAASAGLILLSYVCVWLQNRKHLFSRNEKSAL